MKKVLSVFTLAIALAAVFIFGPKAEVKEKTKVTTVASVAQTEHFVPLQAVEKTTIPAAVTNTMFTALSKTDDQCCAPACHSALPPNLPAGMYNNSSGDIGIGTNTAVMPCPAGFNANSSFGGLSNKHKAVLSAVVLKPAWCGSNVNTLTKEAVATNDITVLRLES